MKTIASTPHVFAHIILKIYKYLFSNIVYENQTQYSNANLNNEG